MPRKIIAAVDDLFFASKMRATAQPLEVEVIFARGIEQLINRATEERPDLVVVDLHHQKIDPIALALKLKENSELQSLPLIGFFSHVETELKRKAFEVGYDDVVPRSVFSRDLAKILKGDIR